MAAVVCEAGHFKQAHSLNSLYIDAHKFFWRVLFLNLRRPTNVVLRCVIPALDGTNNETTSPSYVKPGMTNARSNGDVTWPHHADDRQIMTTVIHAATANRKFGTIALAPLHIALQGFTFECNLRNEVL